MTEKGGISQGTRLENLPTAETKDLKDRIEYEISNWLYRALNIGAVANVIGGFFYVLSLYKEADRYTILAWYTILVLTNLINVLWALRFQAKSMTWSDLQNWQRGFYVIVAAICLTWSSIGILFINASNQEHVTTLFFLLAVLICFGFSTCINFKAVFISINCLLLPSIIYRGTLAVQNISHYGHDTDLNVGVSVAFIVLGIFLLVVSYIVDIVARRFLWLSFENVIFSKKLSGMNKILEQKVKERTTELENSLSLVKFQASHDLLTELPNQRMLLDYVGTAMAKATKNKCMFALACFSINGMIKINDGLGPEAGDLIIKRVAQRFVNMFVNVKNKTPYDTPRYTVTVSRRDVFVILIEPIFNLVEIETITNNLFSVLAEPIYVKNQMFTLTASIGVSIYPKDGHDVNTIYMNADAARIRAVQQGGNSIRLYDALHNAGLDKQIDIETQLHHALKNNELRLLYQPIIDIKTGEISCVEALLRWENPKLGTISPDSFIHIAETNGLIIPIGMWVFATACRQLQSWQKMGFTDLRISINLSYKQLLEKDIVSKFNHILTNLNLSPKFVEFELIEREAFQNDAIPIFKQIRELGIRLSIDDFGTGYSALSSLKLFQIDKIKIDKSFVQDVTTNSDSRNIVINTISLAKSLNATIVAEGVETVQQLKFLQENGCEYVQGYYFSKPIDPEKFLNLLKNQATLRTLIEEQHIEEL